MAIMLLSIITFLPTPRGPKRDRPVASFGGVFPEISPASDLSHGDATGGAEIGPNPKQSMRLPCVCVCEDVHSHLRFCMYTCT